MQNGQDIALRRRVVEQDIANSDGVPLLPRFGRISEISRLFSLPAQLTLELPYLTVMRTAFCV